MRVNKIKVVEFAKIKCTFDVRYGASNTYFFIESLLDESILQVGSGSANEELTDIEMENYALNRVLEFVKLTRYKEHLAEYPNCKKNISLEAGSNSGNVK